MNIPEIIERKIRPLVQQNKNIAIMISGGLDSAILSYTVMKVMQGTRAWPHLRFVTVPRTDNAVEHARRVLLHLSFMCPTISYGHIVVGDPTLHHSQQVRSGVTAFLTETPDLGVLLMAANKTPVDLPNGPVRFNSSNPKVRLPFFSLDKDKIVQYAIDEKLYDLVRLTHSCTELKVGRCAQCWQCRERAWAFQKCGQPDPGDM